MLGLKKGVFNPRSEHKSRRPSRCFAVLKNSVRYSRFNRDPEFDEEGEMKKVLLVTVGGSSEPVVTSIQKNKPQYVVFFCTEDSGGQKGSAKTITKSDTGSRPPCKKCNHEETYKNIAIEERTGLNKDQYEIVIVKPDDPWDIFQKTNAIIARFQEENANITVDYTGGTKSMGLGIGMAATINEGCDLTVVAGDRIDLIKVQSGMEFLRRFPHNPLLQRVRGEMADTLFAIRDYAGCENVLVGILEKEEEQEKREWRQKLYFSRELH